MSSHLAPSSDIKVARLVKNDTKLRATSQVTRDVPTGVSAVIPVPAMPDNIPRSPAHQPPSLTCEYEKNERGRWGSKNAMNWSTGGDCIHDERLRISYLHNSMRVDEGGNSWKLPAIQKKARTVVGRGKKSLAA